VRTSSWLLCPVAIANHEHTAVPLALSYRDFTSGGPALSIGNYVATLHQTSQSNFDQNKTLCTDQYEGK
jgi:hypothetical protein